MGRCTDMGEHLGYILSVKSLLMCRKWGKLKTQLLLVQKEIMEGKTQSL